MELRTQPLVHSLQQVSRRAQESLVVFSPYITRQALRSILDVSPARSVNVVTTWTTRDVALGLSDSSVYEIVKERRGTVRLLPTLHMKAVVADFADMLIGSANITRAGIGLHCNGNVECGVICKVTRRDENWFKALLNKSQIVTDDAYLAFAEHVRNYNVRDCSAGVEFDWSEWATVGSIAFDAGIRLPISPDPDVFITMWLAILKNRATSLPNQSDIESDLALLHLEGVRPRDEYDARSVVRHAYTNLPVVQEFVRFVNRERYFGAMRRWLTRRSDHGYDRAHITDATNRLLIWIAKLFPERYRLDRPSYSSRLVSISA